MFGHRKGFIGVDIGSTTVKLAQIEKNGSRYRLVAASMASRTAPLDTSMWLRSNPASASNEISKALTNAKFSGRRTACTAPVAVCDIRTVSANGESESELRSTIIQQLAQIHAIPQDNIYFDFWRSQNSQPDEFNVLSIADRWAQQILNDHKQARLSCNILDSLPHALARAAAMTHNYNPAIPLLLFDWGENTATVCISVDAQPIYVRSLSGQGFADLRRRIGQALDMTEIETREVISEYGLPKDPASAAEIENIIGEILSPASIELIDEILRTLAFLKTQQPKLTFTNGFVFGAGAVLKNVGPWLGEKLGLTLKAWNGFDNAPQSSSRIPFELLGPAIASSSHKWSSL